MNAARKQLEEMLSFVMEDRGRGTKNNAVLAMKYWFEYCSQVNLTSWRDCDYPATLAWIAWVKARGFSASHALGVVSIPLRCLELLQQVEPESVHKSFVIPTAHLPQRVLSYRKQAIDSARLDRMLQDCVCEVEKTTVTDKSSVVPFLVLFCLRTGMNVSSVLTLQRGCTRADRGGHWIYWNKERSVGAMRNWYEPEPWGAVEIIHHLEDIHSHPYIFSYREKPISQISHEVRTWCKAHGIREFCPREIRSALATRMYQRNPKDIEAIRRFLHHRNLRTTLLYLAANVVKPINERILAGAQEWMLEQWGIPKEGDL